MRLSAFLKWSNLVKLPSSHFLCCQQRSFHTDMVPFCIIPFHLSIIGKLLGLFIRPSRAVYFEQDGLQKRRWLDVLLFNLVFP